MKSPLDPPADPLNEFNKVLSEAREIRERVTQGLQASLVEPKFSESMLPTAAAPGPTIESSPDIPVLESLDEPSQADLTPSQ
ncbi:MAG TPA: hypothetical protein VHU81_15260 [Thermoanaerobaculia bacterium]|nr:hypothetical protein [Thermoanaerobaculia bacterium]